MLILLFFFHYTHSQKYKESLTKALMRDTSQGLRITKRLLLYPESQSGDLMRFKFTLIVERPEEDLLYAFTPPPLTPLCLSPAALS
jgi:hypothetical protein